MLELTSCLDIKYLKTTGSHFLKLENNAFIILHILHDQCVTFKSKRSIVYNNFTLCLKDFELRKN